MANFPSLISTVLKVVLSSLNFLCGPGKTALERLERSSSETKKDRSSDLFLSTRAAREGGRSDLDDETVRAIVVV